MSAKVQDSGSALCGGSTAASQFYFEVRCTSFWISSLTLFPVILFGIMENDRVTLLLPPLLKTDPLFAKKKKLLQTRGASLEFHIPVFESSIHEEAIQVLQKMVVVARVQHLDEVELYFAGNDDFGPFSSRNELESLNSVFSVIHISLQTALHDSRQTLEILADRVVNMIKSFGDMNTFEMIADQSNSSVEDVLMKWGVKNGAKTKLRIAHFEGAGRGAVAVDDINIGDTALDIPYSILISEEILCHSDMFHLLKAVDGMNSETMLLLWSMKERYNTSSKFKAYFDSLPQTFNTGLSFGVNALGILEGTLLFEEILQAKQHLRKQYEALCPNLCSLYPDIFPPALYTWDQFLWACELWYSNGMKIVLTDGSLKMCLVPIAGFLNHSVCHKGPCCNVLE